MRLLKRLLVVTSQRQEVLIQVGKLLAEVGSCFMRYDSSLPLTVPQGTLSSWKCKVLTIVNIYRFRLFSYKFDKHLQIPNAVQGSNSDWIHFEIITFKWDLCPLPPLVYIFFRSDDADFNYSKACEVFKGNEESCRNCRILHVLNDRLIHKEWVRRCDSVLIQSFTDLVQSFYSNSLHSWTN